MSIAYLPGAYFPDPGGAQVQVHNLANIMSEDKINVDVLVLKKTNIKKTNYNIIYLNKYLINIIFIFHYYFKINLGFFLDLYLGNLIKKKKYKVWHFVFLNYKSLILINSLYNLKQKIIVTFQGADIQINKKISYGNRLDKKYDFFLKKTLNKISKFTSISKNIYSDLIKIGVKKHKIYNIPNGVPLKNFKRNRFKLKRKNKKFKLITVARYAEKKKGYDLVPGILKNLIKFKINFEWIIIGKKTSKLLDDPFIRNNKKYFKILDNLYIKKEKYFPNDKIIKEYLGSNLYVNLSRIESFGITFVEALSANIPVITFNTKGANEIIINNYNGFIVQNNDNKIFCRKIKKIYQDKNFFKKYPFQSSKKYDLETLKKKFLEIY